MATRKGKGSAVPIRREARGGGRYLVFFCFFWVWWTTQAAQVFYSWSELCHRETSSNVLFIEGVLVACVYFVLDRRCRRAAGLLLMYQHWLMARSAGRNAVP